MTRSDVQTGTLPQLLYHRQVPRPGWLSWLPVALLALQPLVLGMLVYLYMRQGPAPLHHSAALFAGGMTGILLAAGLWTMFNRRLIFQLRYPVLLSVTDRAVSVGIATFGSVAYYSSPLMQVYVQDTAQLERKYDEEMRHRGRPWYPWAASAPIELELYMPVGRGRVGRFVLLPSGRSWTTYELRKLSEVLRELGMLPPEE